MPPQQYPQQQVPQHPQQYGQNTRLIGRAKSFIIPLIISVVVAVIFIGLFVWAFMAMTDYKLNSDEKAAAAVKVAVMQEASRKDNEFLEKEKSPVKTFVGSDTFGGVTFSYPKTWSSYVVQSEKAAAPVDGYFHPDVVPDIAGNTAYALRVRVLNKTYDQHLKSLEGKIKQGKVTLTAYNPLKQKSVVGVRVDGEVNVGQKDHMIILPLRDKTIEISTESDQFKNDFDKIILETLNFTP